MIFTNLIVPKNCQCEKKLLSILLRKFRSSFCDGFIRQIALSTKVLLMDAPRARRNKENAVKKWKMSVIMQGWLRMKHPETVDMTILRNDTKTMCLTEEPITSVHRTCVFAVCGRKMISSFSNGTPSG